MKLTINQTNNTVTSVRETRIVQNSDGISYVYIYGVASGQVVKCTFRKPDGNLIGPVNSVYDHDADDVACFVCIIPSPALTLAGDIGVSVAVYSAPFWQASISSYWAAHGSVGGTYDVAGVASTGSDELPTAPTAETAGRVSYSGAYAYYVSKVNIQTTVRSSGFIYESDTVEFPEELATEITDDLYAKHNGLVDGSISHDAIVVIGNASVGGTLGVTGNAAFGNVAASGAVNVAQSLVVGNGATINGSTQINGGANFASGVNIIGNVTAGNVAINGASSHVGNASFGNISASGAIVGASILSNAAINAASMNLTGNAAIGGNVTINGSVVIETNLEVHGESNLVSLTITGDDVDVNDNKIVNLANGSADGDAVNIGQLTLSLAYKQDVSEKDQANGYAGLNSNGKLANSVIPAVALTNRFKVASEVAQLAITTAEEGDIAIRSDIKKSYIHNGGTAGTMDDWDELLTPTDTVLSVNGEYGTVTLDASDIATDQVGQTIQDALDILEQDAVDIAALESEQTTQNDRLTAVEGENDTIQESINSMVVNSTAMQDMLARQQPTTELSLATPTTALASKVANINRFHFKGLTLKNKAKNGNAVNIANYTTSNGALTASANVFSFLASAQNGYFRQAITLISGHVYHIHAQISVASNAVSFFLNDGLTDFATVSHSASSGYETLSVIGTAGASGSFYFTIKDARASGWTNVLVKNIVVSNLTTLGTHPSGVHWHDMTASQIDAFIGNLDTTSQIVAKAIAGGETTKISNGIMTDGDANGLADGWTKDAATATIENGAQKLTATGTANYCMLYHSVTALTVGKTYYISFDFTTNDTTDYAQRIYFDGATKQTIYESTTKLTSVSLVFTATYANTNFAIGLYRATPNIPNTVWFTVDNVLMYDITSYYRTADLVSFTPLAITCTDGVTTLSTATTNIQVMHSLPDGQADEFDFYVEDDPADADFQSRMMEKTKRALRIDLPDAQVGGVDKWQLGKVGTTAARFFIKLEDLATASGHTIQGDNADCYVDSFAEADDEVGSYGANYVCSIALPAGLETWAEDATPTILLKHAALSLITMDALQAGTSGFALTDDSQELWIALPEATYPYLGAFTAYLAANPVSVVIPYDTKGATTDNLYTSSLTYPLSTFNAHCADAASLSFYKDHATGYHYISLKLPVATADTLSELYTYLVANPLSVIVEIADEVSTISQAYVKQTGNNLTIAATSSTSTKAGAFDATVALDPNVKSITTVQRPSAPTAGMMFFDSTLGKCIVYSGSAWLNVNGTALA